MMVTRDSSLFEIGGVDIMNDVDNSLNVLQQEARSHQRLKATSGKKTLVKVVVRTGWENSLPGHKLRRRLTYNTRAATASALRFP